MQTEDIRSLLQAAPFKPFTVFTVSEKAYPVPHPDFAFLTPNGQMLIIARADSGTVDLLDVPLIARIEVPARPARKR